MQGPPSLASPTGVIDRRGAWASAVASRLGECSSQPAQLVHSSLAFAVQCQAEAPRGPSTAVSYFFRKSLPL